jgi:DNA-binding NarL/FixJ family response regulator
VVQQKKTILIVDDHPLFREGLKSLLKEEAAFEVVGEAGSCAQSLEKAAALRPDMILMDISLPDGSGIEATRSLRGRYPKCRIAILSMHAKIDYITEAFRAGATGYVVKESAAERLVDCLNAVSRGEYFIDASISHKVVESLMRFDRMQAKVTDAGYGTLTPREQQLMRLLAEGLSPKQIGEKLCISPKTVENHRTNIMSKLELHSTMDLVRYAARLGLIDVDLWKG